MKRPLVIMVLAVLLLALTLACSPSRLFGGDLGDYVSRMRTPLQEFAAWAQEVLTFADAALKTRDAQVICGDDTLVVLAERGRDITDRMDAIEPPAAVATPHDAVRNAARGVVDSLDKAHGLICEQKDLEGGLDTLQDALGPIEDLLGKLQELQKLLPTS